MREREAAVEIRLRAAQMEVFRSPKRFRVVAAGRRFGKTQLGLVEVMRAVWGAKKTAWYVAPSYRQAKSIAWERLKILTRPYWAATPNESDASVRLKGGGSIALRGAEQCDALRGHGWISWFWTNTHRCGQSAGQACCGRR